MGAGPGHAIRVGMHILKQGRHILFGVLTPSYLEETVSLACTVFSQREPMAQALGLTVAELRPYVEAYASAACAEELGVIALDQSTGRVVGFSLAKDYLTSLQLQVPSKLLPMQEVSTTLDSWFLGDYGSPRNYGILGHEVMTGVASEHPYLEARKATSAPTLGHELMAVRTALLRGRGFQRSIAVATGPRSQKLHACLGAYRICSVGYREFTFTRERQQPFSALSGQYCALLLKDLHEAPIFRAPAVRWPRGLSFSEMAEALPPSHDTLVAA
jgi:hypothetical protein